ncbi:MAG: 30S ribosomal protein S2 [Alphaproteobacteria bacterium]|nr:30S ribosomal protein S2 [Alphaproteobacteria bacterium]MBO7537473.1 30S ribosomal protein S2 [Alphaproteobacteria bacterium]MBO7642157.1 30S ribosomal protein S2 [Alphaproteobacteria bacterium]
MQEVSIKSLLEAGVHFGHQTRRWNPKMAPYIFGSKDKIHIINLDKTAAMMREALSVAGNVAAEGGRILFVGTKRQASERVAEAAQKCGQYYVNHRWLGGMLTNWKTVSQSIKKLETLENRLKDENIVLKKKEILSIERKIEKFNRALGGVRSMGGIPSLLFVLDVTLDKTAVEEARVLGIPVIGICDTNSDPSVVDFPIPGNDDSSRAIELYCTAMENAIIEGIQKGLSSSGVDVGALENPVVAEEVSEESTESGDDQSQEAVAE